MPYFTAVLASDPSGWRARDVDVPAGSLDELAEVLRAAAVGEAPVLAAIESEDEWFALVRADPSGEARFFVSDALAAGSGGYAGLFADDALPAEYPVAPPVVAGDEGDGDGEDGDGEDGGSGAAAAPAAPWAGDPGLLSDLGCPAGELLELAERGDDPAAALAEVGELLGCADVMESLR
ncbi:hypothetical protein [Kineococcus glutinatus]|uniref:tRNA adenosine deaminase-associated protein n=1 Tax=Kineococcus glutinatus TaxID=1070872 RepID=A0ABP9HWW4_9ACTN